MSKRKNQTQRTALEEYLDWVLRVVYVYLPTMACCAAALVTVAKCMGPAISASWGWVIAFDALCVSYFFLTYIFVRVHSDHHKLRLSSLKLYKLCVAAALALQYNFIIYVFPNTEQWAYTIFFVLLVSFFLDSKYVIIVSAEMIVSLAVSWLVQPELMLPPAGPHQMLGIALRVVCVLLSMFCIWIVTYLVERTFMTRASQRQTMEEYGIVTSQLASIYTAVYLLNLNDDTYRCYNLSEDERRLIGRYVDDNNNWKKAINIIMQFVLADDRHLFEDLIDHLPERLDEGDGHYSFRFLRLYSDSHFYHTELSCIRDSSHSSRVLLAFRNVDRDVRREQERQQQIEKVRTDTTRMFADSFLGMYVSAYYVDLTDNTYLVFSREHSLEERYGDLTDYIESITQYIDESVHPDDRAKMLDTLQPEALRKRLAEVPKFSVYMRDISGPLLRWYRCMVMRGADDDHVALGFMDVTRKIIEDETHARQLQEALTMAQSANRAKTVFLNNMSHDIRTPMNAITGYTRLATTHLDDRQLVAGCLSKIDKSSAHLLSLINDVLDMSRIESGRMLLNEKPEELSDIVTAIRDIVTADLDAHHHAFTLDTSDLRGVLVHCDRLRLTQVLLNLLSNAIKYTPDGGTITFAAHCQAVGEEGNFACAFTVQDNGMGMSSEFLATVFEPFTRAATATESGIQGTGLGMAITRSIVELMGGTIDIQSAPGEGTKAIVTLCFRRATDEEVAAKAATVAAQRALDFNGCRVLLVEDNEFNREIATILLQEAGFVVSTAENGAQAVEAVRAAAPGDYDAILMDVQMPVMDGYEATRRIRALGTTPSRVPIIAMTANAFEEDRRQALAAGMDEHIAKPIDFDHLREVLARFLKPTATPPAQE